MPTTWPLGSALLGVTYYATLWSVVVEAHEERAREVLLRMTKSIGYRMQWLERYDFGGSFWAINMIALRRDVTNACGQHLQEVLRWPGVPQFGHPLPPCRPQ